jgi:hypothetical protein
MTTVNVNPVYEWLDDGASHLLRLDLPVPGEAWQCVFLFLSWATAELLTLKMHASCHLS